MNDDDVSSLTETHTASERETGNIKSKNKASGAVKVEWAIEKHQMIHLEA